MTESKAKRPGILMGMGAVAATLGVLSIFWVDLGDSSPTGTPMWLVAVGLIVLGVSLSVWGLIQVRRGR
jgi:hypothetical protein